MWNEPNSKHTTAVPATVERKAESRSRKASWESANRHCILSRFSRDTKCRDIELNSEHARSIVRVAHGLDDGKVNPLLPSPHASHASPSRPERASTCAASWQFQTGEARLRMRFEWVTREARLRTNAGEQNALTIRKKVRSAELLESKETKQQCTPTLVSKHKQPQRSAITQWRKPDTPRSA